MRGVRRALLPVALVLLVVACASGTITTSTGQVVPAATVQAQDTVADVLKGLDDGYKGAVAAHDALAATEDPAVHAAHRKILLDTRAGLILSWDALIAWKSTNAGAAPRDVLSSVVSAARDFVPLAIQLGAVKPADGQKILSTINALFPGGAP